MSSITIFNPVALPVEKRLPAAARIDGIDGKRIGLYWNMKPGGDVGLREVERLLSERYPNARFSYFEGDIGALMKKVTPAAADRIAKECDAIVGTTAD